MWRVSRIAAGFFMVLHLVGMSVMVRAEEGPRFETTACTTFRVPSPPSGRSVSCGYVTVPETHAKPDGPTIRLAVVRFRAARDDSGDRPVFYLAGGPGGRGITPGWTGDRANYIARDRDLIVFDQRGVGYSQPNLECPEVRQQSVTDPALSLGDDERQMRRLNGLIACRDRLVGKGVDLAAYNSTENAADINDIRRALGYDTIDLLGVSYGTRLAQTAMRDFPQMLHAAVLDSTLPMQEDGETHMAVSFDRALNTLFDDCVASSACNGAFPTLRQDFATLVTRLDAQPITLQLPVSASSASATPAANTTEYRVNGARFLGLLHTALYSRVFIERLPALITHLRDGKTDLLKALYQQMSGGPATSLGMGYSVECSELAAFSNPDSVRAATADMLPAVRDDYVPGVLAIFASCARWPAHMADPRDHQPVMSDVPTLILESANDPITPPAFGDQVASALTNSFVVHTPGVGHSVVGNGGVCGTNLTLMFLARPDAMPDTSCVGRLGVIFATDA